MLALILILVGVFKKYLNLTNARMLNLFIESFSSGCGKGSPNLEIYLF